MIFRFAWLSRSFGAGVLVTALSLLGLFEIRVPIFTGYIGELATLAVGKFTSNFLIALGVGVLVNILFWTVLVYACAIAWSRYRERRLAQ